MPLDGLRAWIAEVEHKLGMRTRVFLVLATIAIGGAGAAIYLAIDTRDDVVSKSDVQTLQDELKSQAGNAAPTGSEVAGLEAELKALQAQMQALQAEDEASAGESKDSGATGTGNAPEASDGGSGAADTVGEKAPGQVESAEETEKQGKPSG
ncbi:MAG TPA: hypothetical protein VIE64_05710 [Solirubrobacterales bacterium]|jgi:hypothetical protein